MGRFARSWELVKASVAVLRADHRLLIFPLMAGVCTMIVSASFLGPLALGGVLDRFDDARQPWWMAPIVFLFYLVQYFVIFFFNSALVGAARIRLDGGNPSVRDGFRIAASRWTQILGYALIAATVGMILRAIEERAGFIGRWISALLGVTWTMATFLAVPVLVSGNVGPVDTVKQSAELLKRTWGENLVGNVGIGLVSGVAIVAWVLMCVGLVALATSTHSVAAVIAAVAVGILGIVTLSLVQSALQGVYAAALHRYAQTGDAGIGFERALLADAFKLKA